jgi:DNA modification methylase
VQLGEKPQRSLTDPNSNNYWDLSDFSKLVTPLQNKHLPVYRWYSFKHSFSRNLVHNLIESLNLTENDIVLDPFCGAGTTLLACKEKGIRAIGLDLMPLSVSISNAKVGSYSVKKIEHYLKHLDDLHPFMGDLSTSFQRISKYFPPENLELALSLKYFIEKINDRSTRVLFRAALMSIMEEISYARKDGAFVRMVKNKKTNETIDSFRRKISLFMDDIPFLNALPKTHARARLGDARNTKLPAGSISAVITSPPYPNRHDYTRIYYLELIMGFYQDYEEIKRLRYELIRSHVEAREKYESVGYKQPQELSMIIDKLKAKNLPNRNVISLVEGYFEDMHIFLAEMKKVLKDNGNLCIVIGDSRYGGISVPAGEIVIEIARNLGFELIRNTLARDKGNSPQQMGTFGKVLSKESIIILKK